MSRAPRFRLICVLAWLASAVMFAGCQKPTPVNNPNRYIPDSASARRAVLEALTSRRDAWSRERIASSPGKSRLVDNQRRPGQRLKDFTILGEVSAEKARGFAVRLTLENPDEIQQARYLVYGVDPIWVFRQEDFDLITHWEHAMDAAEPASTEAESAPVAQPEQAPREAATQSDDHHGTPPK